MFYLLDTTSGGFYTGKTGDDWVMAEEAEAFGYECEELAQRKADKFNKGRRLHGKFFEVVSNGF